MGSDSGHDVEAPVHRVWVDSFDLAATQETVDKYARFLNATGRTAPTFWGDLTFSHPQQPVVAVSWYDAVHRGFVPRNAGGGHHTWYPLHELQEPIS